MEQKNNGGIILNDDFAHFIASRYNNGIDVNKEVIHDYIDQYIGTQVTKFCLNVNASLSYSPSEIIETVFSKYLQKDVEGIPVDFSDTYLSLAYDIYVTKGLDLHKIIIDRLRYIGIEPWLSIRMNDLHGFTDKLDNRTTSFRNYAVNNNLCRTTHRPHTDYYDQCFDYMLPEIKNRMLAYIDEQLENYDVDGIELDFLREAFCFKIGEEDEGKLIINDMLYHIKDTISKLAQRRGHNIKIMVRVPSDPLHAYNMGFDIYTWAREKLVDYLIVSPRFATCDSTMPLESWIRIFENDDMEIVGGIEIFTHPRIEKINPSFCNTLEMATGYAVEYLSEGAEKIYLYNYFDNPSLKGDCFINTMSFTNEDIRLECENVREASVQAPCFYKKFLSTAGKLETCINLPRRHILTYCDIAPQWVPITAKLPFTVQKADYSKITRKTEYACIKTGKIPLSSQVSLLVGIENAKAGEDLTVWCNNELCEYIRTTKIYPVLTSSKIHVYRIPDRTLKWHKQIFEFSSDSVALKIDYLEVRIIKNGDING